MKLAVASDHAGFKLKQAVVAHLKAKGHQAADLGAADETPSDYPDFAGAVSEQVAAGKAERGVIVCGSGVGACMVANKFPGVRATQAFDLYTARQSVEHDDANVLCLGSRTQNEADALRILDEWLASGFTGEERHARRLAKLKAIEKRYLKET